MEHTQGAITVASASELHATATSLGTPMRCIFSLSPTTILVSPDRTDVEQTYHDGTAGAFWFHQFATRQTINDLHSVCVSCDPAQGGLVSLADGGSAIVWAGGQGRTDVIWFRHGVEYGLEGPPSTFQRAIALKFANQVVAG